MSISILKIVLPMCFVGAADPGPPGVQSAVNPNARVFKVSARAAQEVAAFLVKLPPTETPGQAAPACENCYRLQVAGYIRPYPLNLDKVVGWEKTAGRQAAAIELVSKGAVALRVQFAGGLDRNGLQLRVYDPQTGATFGPYSNPILNDDGTWWTTIIFGDSIGLEFVHSGVGEAPPRLPAIKSIAYYYDPPDAGGLRSCAQIDVTCEPSWASEANAVTMLSVVSGNNVAGYCTGALLNRSANDFAPLVMTANHCVGGNGGQPTANSTAFVWGFETSQCDGPPPNPNSLPRSDGALLLKVFPGNDWNLLGLYEPPSAFFYLGWDSAGWPSGDAATGIHHPDGTYKRIAFGQSTGESTMTFCDQNGQNCFDVGVWHVQFSSGSMLPGSSGSPIFDSNRRVRGTSTGGLADDCTRAFYGRLEEAFPTLQPYLFDIASPVFADVTYGGFEAGTASQPFNTVFEASFCVTAGDTVRVRPGNYPETFTIRRPMTLTVDGAGTVTIGQ